MAPAAPAPAPLLAVAGIFEILAEAPDIGADRSGMRQHAGRRHRVADDGRATGTQDAGLLEEELDADLYEDPVPADDLDAYARLSGELEVPVAAGSTLGSADFVELIRRTRVSVVRPDLGRVGGISSSLGVSLLLCFCTVSFFLSSLRRR